MTRTSPPRCAAPNPKNDDLDGAVLARLGLEIPPTPLLRTEADWSGLLGIPRKTLATERREGRIAVARARNSATAPVLISRGAILAWLLTAADRAVVPSVATVAAAKRIHASAPAAQGGAA